MRTLLIALLLIVAAGSLAAQPWNTKELRQYRTTDTLDLSDTCRTPWYTFDHSPPARLIYVKIRSTAPDTIRVDCYWRRVNGTQKDSAVFTCAIFQPLRSGSPDTIAVLLKAAESAYYEAEFRIYLPFYTDPFSLRRIMPYGYKPDRVWYIYIYTEQ